MIRATLALLLLAAAANASPSARTLDGPLADFSYCQNVCLPAHKATKSCHPKSCEIVKCRLSSYRWGKRCAPKVVEPSSSPSPSAIAVQKCPAVCKSRKQAKKDCHHALAWCKLVNCEYPRNGRYRKGKSCVDKILPPNPEPLACPEVCLDPKWGKKKCEEPLYRVMCEAVPCTRLVKGKYTRPGVICTKKVTPTPSPSASTKVVVMGCPERCIDPKWGKKQCKEHQYKIMCEAVSCTRYVKGGPKPGVICTKKKESPSPKPVSPCPERCIDPKWGKKRCEHPKYKIMCEAVPCYRDVKGKQRPGVICTKKGDYPIHAPIESSSPSASASPIPVVEYYE